MAEQSSNTQRNKMLTIIVLIAIIVLGMIIGALAVANGDPTVTFPESKAVEALEFAAKLAGVTL